MNTARLAELKAEYARANTENERAVTELRIWNELRDRTVAAQKNVRPKFVAGLLGVRAVDVDQRSRLYGYGDTVDVLWQRVEKDLTYKTAISLAQRAKRTKQKGENIYQAMARVLAEYDALPMVRHLPGGKSVRQPSPTRLVRERAPDSERAAPKSAPAAQAERQFWQALRALIGPEFQRRLRGQSEPVVLRELQRFETELKIMFELAAQRCSSYKGGALSETLLKRRLSDACLVLKLDPPRAGEATPEFFKKAQKQFKALARQYHPDTHGGSDVTRPQYESVLEAWAVLQQYQETFGQSPKESK